MDPAFVGAGAGAMLALIALLVLFEFWPRPFPVQAISGPEVISPFFEELGTDSTDYAILEVPHLKQTSAMYQAYHGKRTVGGRISREKEHPWFDAARFFAPMLQIKEPWPEIAVDNSVAAWRQALSCQNVRYVVFYKQNLSKQHQTGGAALQKALFDGVQPAYEDDLLRAYGPITDTPETLYWIPAKDWYDLETIPNGPNYRWMIGEKGSLLAYPCNQSQQESILRFNTSSYTQPRTMQILVNGQEIKQVQVGVGAFTPVEVPLSLRSGENRIELRSVEPATSPASLGAGNDDRQLSLMISEVSILPR